MIGPRWANTIPRDPASLRGHLLIVHGIADPAFTMDKKGVKEMNACHKQDHEDGLTGIGPVQHDHRLPATRPGEHVTSTERGNNHE